MWRGGGGRSTTKWGDHPADGGGGGCGGGTRTFDRSGKAVLHVIIVMALAASCDGFDEHRSGCSNPVVAKLGFYNERRSNGGGFLRVHNRSVVADGVNSDCLFKISADNGSFYLYDPKAKRFICWNKNFSAPVPRRYKKSEDMHLCAFKDSVSETHPNTHVEFRHRDRPAAVLRFTRRGRFATRRSAERCARRRRRRRHQCASAALLAASASCDAGCGDAARHLCGDRELAGMRELRPVCGPRPRHGRPA